jgi:hypothetical protein
MSEFKFPTCIRGETYVALVPISLDSGSIADCVIRMMVKASFDDADGSALVSIDNDALGGIEIVSATAPISIRVTIADDVTAAFSFTGPGKSYVTGISLEMSDGTTEKVGDLNPRFFVGAHAVRAVASP